MNATDTDAIRKFKDTLGSYEIGFTLMTALWGISMLQIWLYYRNYPKDHILLKTLIGVLWSLDTASTAFMAHTIYTYTILNLNNLSTEIPWSTVALYAANLFTTLFAQGYYSYQIWQVSHRMALVATIVVLAILSFGTGLVTVIRLSIKPDESTTSEPTVLIVGSCTQATGAACDIIITISLIYFFRVNMTTFRKTRRMFEQLITYAITRGTLTTLCQIMFLILLQKIPYKNATFYAPFLQLVGKLYVNSVLASLNARSALRDRGEDTLNVMSMALDTFSAGGGSTTQARSQRTVKLDTVHTRTFDTAYMGQHTDKSDADSDVKIKPIAITREIEQVTV